MKITRSSVGTLFFLTAAVLMTAGCLMAKKGTVLEDSAGRYSYRVTPEMQEVARQESFAHYVHSGPDMDVYLVAAEGDTEEKALTNTFARAGIDYMDLTSGGVAGFGQWRLERFIPDGDTWYAVASQYRGSTAYAFIVRGGLDSDPDSLPSPVFGMLSSISFTGEAGEVFVPHSFGELEEQVDALTAKLGGSISIAAIKDGKIVYEYAGGLANPGTPADTGVAYHWGSITKTVISVAIMQLVERGTVDLDATVDTYLSEFAPGAKIAVRDLLGHTSGIIEDRETNQLTAFNAGSLPTVTDVWEEYWPTVDRLAYEPRTSLVYTNYNFLVLGAILERVTGEELTGYVRREIFDPVGMHATAHRSADLPAGTVEASPVIPHAQLDKLLEQLAPAGNGYDEAVMAETDSLTYLNPVDIFPCWGGVKGTAADAVRFGQLFIDLGETSNGRILERKTVNEMMTAQKTADGTPMAFGLGWKVVKDGRASYIEHSGGGPGIDSLLRVYPKEGIAIAVLGSVTGYGSGSILEYTLDLID